MRPPRLAALLVLPALLATAAGTSLARPALAASHADTAAAEIAAPSLVAGAQGIEAYSRAPGGALVREDSTGVQTSLGGVLTSAPEAVSMVPGRVDVFARGGDGQLMQRYAVADRWSPWLHLGGRAVGAPAVTSWAPGRLDLFATGPGGTLQHRWFSAGRWSGWEDLGGSLASAPSAVSMVPGRLDVFARGTDGALQHVYYPGGGWSRWSSLGGTLYSQPAALTTGDGRLEIAVLGGDGALRLKQYVRGDGWSSYGVLPGAVSSGPGAVVAADGSTTLAARDSSGTLLQRTRPADGAWPAWSPAAPVAAPSVALPPGVSPPPSVALPPGVSPPPSVALPPGVPPPPSAVDPLAPPLTAPPAVVPPSIPTPSGQQPVPVQPLTGGAAGGTAVRPSGVGPFTGLGAWVDLYDYALPGAPLTPDAALDDLHARGVRTLCLQTSRFSVGFDVASQAARWVDGAHARGMSVVGWYLPGYGDMARDLRRTLAIASLVTPAGGHVDALGIDIEAHTGLGPSYEVSRTTMNMRAAQNLADVRSRTSMPLAAITPQPTATDGAGETWAGFPWKAVGADADVVLPMSYWPRSCRDACVRDYTMTNARYAAAWTGLPVHIAGRGYPTSDGTTVSDSDIRAFVDGALAAGVVGGSVYDYASTRSRTAWWPSLRRLG